MADASLERLVGLPSNLGRQLPHRVRNPLFEVAGRERGKPATKGGGRDTYAEPSANKRSGPSKVAIDAALYTSYGKYVLDSTRTYKKLPEAARRGRLARGVFEAVSGNPTTTIIDPTRDARGNIAPGPHRTGPAPAPAPAASATGAAGAAGAPASATKSESGFSARRAARRARPGTFSRVDGIAYRSSMALGAGMAAVNLASALPNLAEAVKLGDAIKHRDPLRLRPARLGTTRSGRSGVSQAIGGGVMLTLLGKARNDAIVAGHTGAWNVLSETMKSPRLTRPWVALGVGFGMGAATILNEAGVFDFMNGNDPRPMGKRFSDAGDNLVGAAKNVGEFITGAPGDAADFVASLFSAGGGVARYVKPPIVLAGRDS